MTNGTNYEPKLWDLLVGERLVDLSQFQAPGFFDEVPLVSRESDLAFLSDLPRERAEVVLLGFALKFLKAVVSYEEHRSPFFAAVTARDIPDADWIIPNLFIWSGPIRRLKKKLVLEPLATRFGWKVKTLVRQTHLRSPFEVFEEASGPAEEARVFVSLAEKPYPAFVPLDKFRKAARSVA
jgi:hypothetical protein